MTSVCLHNNRRGLSREHLAQTLFNESLGKHKNERDKGRLLEAVLTSDITNKESNKQPYTERQGLGQSIN